MALTDEQRRQLADLAREAYREVQRHQARMAEIGSRIAAMGALDDEDDR